MTPIRQDTYAANAEHRCPVCNSDQIEGTNVEIANGYAFQPCDCAECGATWVDRYALEGYQELRYGEEVS